MSLSETPVWELNFGPHLPEDKSAPILDVGCGFGDFLGYLESKGYRNLRGVEIDPGRAAASREKSAAAIDTVTDIEPYLRGLEQKFALITLKSVVAHFPRERARGYLQQLGESLQPGGRLVVETFNASRWTGSFVFYNDLTHCWAYTEYTLREMLEGAGLRVIELTGERMPIRGVRAFVWRAMQFLWSIGLRCIYFAERGIGRNPHILGKYIVAVCQKENSTA